MKCRKYSLYLNEVRGYMANKVEDGRNATSWCCDDAAEEEIYGWVV